MKNTGSVANVYINASLRGEVAIMLPIKLIQICVALFDLT